MAIKTVKKPAKREKIDKGLYFRVTPSFFEEINQAKKRPRYRHMKRSDFYRYCMIKAINQILRPGRDK